jgi:hypothetical protein
MCKTTDKLQSGDLIFVRKSGPNKYDPFIYASFGAGVDGSKSPGTDPDIPINVNPPKDDGSGVEPSVTLHFYLDGITTANKNIKGTSSWDGQVAQSLTQAINWRAPVLSSDLLLIYCFCRSGSGSAAGQLLTRQLHDLLTSPL